MGVMHCHRCGRPLSDGNPKYVVAVKVRSLFQGVVSGLERETGELEIEELLREMETSSEQVLNRQVHEDDAFVMCPECKEAFLEEMYSRLRPEATPENGRAHLIH
jgi:hypothetical protein